MTSPFRRLAAGLLLALAVLALGLGAGFAWFAVRAGRSIAAPAQADGIVVLTGGAGRVELALRLLAEGRAARLLVSGTGRAEFSDLAARARVGTALAHQVTLGRFARSTRGNARETEEWVAAHGIHSLIVVTSGYHMPRALIELRRTLPARVTVHPAPLVPTAPDGHDRVPMRLLVAEFAKWLGAAAGFSGMVARDEDAAWAPPGGPGLLKGGG